MYLLGEVRPIETPRELFPKSVSVAPCAFLRKLDLPSKEVVQQPHVGLYKNGKPTRADDEVGVRKGDI